MNCTLIIGPQGSGKLKLALNKTQRYSAPEIYHFRKLIVETEFSIFTQEVSALVPATCKIILVNEVVGVSNLHNWLRLAHAETLLSKEPGLADVNISPSIILVFQSDMPATELLTRDELRHINVVQTSMRKVSLQ